MWDVANTSSKTSIELGCFSPFFFSYYCRSVGPRVVSIVSDSCNQFFTALFYVVFESLYRCIKRCLQCWQVLFLLLFLTRIVCQRQLWDAKRYYDHHYYYITPCKFYAPALVDGLSLFQSEWQQVSSGLQDSSQQSGQPQQCFRLDGHGSSPVFQLLQFP